MNPNGVRTVIPAYELRLGESFEARERELLGEVAAAVHEESDPVAGLLALQRLGRRNEGYGVCARSEFGPICTTATIHLAAAVSKFAWLDVRSSPTETLGFDDSALFPLQPRLEGSHFPVPSTPGLGVEFDETVAARQEFQFWEAPHLHRRDASYTNW